MELFKSELLKKEYEDFHKNLLPAVLECGFCNISSCRWHSKFNGTCVHCRKHVCINCRKFNISKDLLLKSASSETVDYLYNYICDFLNLSDESLKTFFPEIKVEKLEKTHFKTRVTSEKCRTQTVKVKLPTGIKHGQFQVGRWKRRFFY